MSSPLGPVPPNEDQGPVILGATLTVTIAALITMLTRLYVRIFMLRHTGWDDYVMIAAMVLVSVHSSLLFAATSTRCFIKRKPCHMQPAWIAIKIYVAWSQMDFEPTRTRQN